MDTIEGRKRKAAENDKSEPKSKRARKEKPTPKVLDVDADAVGEEEFWKARKEAYHEPISGEQKPGLSQVLDDVINAKTRGIRCRRKPFRVYFDDDDCSSYSFFQFRCSMIFRRSAWVR